jgi:hypothetical protein
MSICQFFSHFFSLSFLFHVIIDLFALGTRRRREEDGREKEGRERLPFGINDAVVWSDEFVFIHV